MQCHEPVRSPESGPVAARKDGSYRPHRDPQVILLVLIVLGTFAVMVGGLGTGPPFGDGGSSGPVFPVWDFDGEDRPDAEELVLTANRTTVDPGDAVRFRVTAKDKPVANATLRVGGRTVETDRNGTAVAVFEDPGSERVTIADSGGGDGSGEAVTVRVRRHEIALTVSAPETAVTGEPVEVTVTRADTGEAVRGTVVVDGRRFETNDAGVAEVTFRTAGDRSVRAVRDTTNTERFVTATATVAVERRVVPLVLELSASETVVGEEVELRVHRRDTGAPVNATVRVGTRTLVTGDDGNSSFVAEGPGTVTVTATAPETPAVRFDSGTSELTVDRRTAALELEVDRPTVPEGERVTFTLRVAETGEPIAGTVRLFGTPYRTDDEGRLRVAFQVPGTVTAVGSAPPNRTTRFTDASRQLTVEGPEFVVSEMTVPESARAGERVTARATITNEGNVGSTETVRYRIGGELVASRTVSLAPGESTRVVLGGTVPSLPSGTYDQRVTAEDGDASSTITVTANESFVDGRMSQRPSSSPDVTTATGLVFAQYGTPAVLPWTALPSGVRAVH
ncbi:CARDB domain-containing protein [Haloarchaeobius sp. TZWWS8]|uniref:CARDB domain-containing protein n=1 Tax=Haloarchaeobius sp. TZWWS8 TaxID=3446121 RepID=UPI003EB9693D